MPKHPSSVDVLARARHFELSGALAAGTVVATGATVQEIIPISQLLRCRIRLETTAGDGTLRAKFLRPVAGVAPEITFAAAAVHTTPTITDTAVAGADTEYLLEIDDLYGEAYLLVQYIDTAGGSTIKRCVFSAL